ncbi:hypothetical protein SN811_01570 [Ligilactobacillus agilis]|uniref:DUF2628 domain-containing protein n=1 Tax=Ligilactobacillus agilis TaxID=1601 RepID=A0A6F9Y2I1_9LACO|nr:DUF2628 domain-containing protein [Ligilactobacillus agilis]GET11657.1 hypothetical protein SN811_01570 [Ligilactobacillus agilis]
MKANLSNPNTNQFKQVKVGFSWTVFFFGVFPPLFRGDWKWFGIILLADLVLAILTAGIGTAIANLVFAFIYNKLYINDLLSSGYVASDETTKRMLASKGFINQE